MDFNAIAQQLIDAVTKASSDQLQSLGQQRQNEFAKINNTNNARGTLYSTQGGYQRTSFDASKYLPAVAEAKQKPLRVRMDVASQIKDVTNQIDAMTRATNALNKMDYNY